MKLFVFLLLIFFKETFAIECGQQKVTKGAGLMVGGEISYHGESPWLASIMLQKDKGHMYICGASLLNQWTLVTGKIYSNN